MEMKFLYFTNLTSGFGEIIEKHKIQGREKICIGLEAASNLVFWIGHQNFVL